MAAMSPPDLDLMILRADPGRVAGQHLRRALRVGEVSSPRSRSGLKVTIGTPRLRRILQIVQHSRAVADRHSVRRRRCVGMCEIVEDTVPTGDADALRQRHRGGLVAHVGAVGQVVGAVKPREEGVEIGRLRGGTAGGVEDGGFGIESLQSCAPIAVNASSHAHGDVAVGRGVIAHRMGQTALLLQIVVGPVSQLAQRMIGEELRRAARVCVSSQIVALAPFSQNSNACGSAGLAQAQETHANPSGLFWRASVSMAMGVGHSSPKIVATPLKEPQPPAGRW